MGKGRGGDPRDRLDVAGGDGTLGVAEVRRQLRPVVGDVLGEGGVDDVAASTLLDAGQHATAGVFVIDAKYYRRMVEIRNKGGLFGSDRRLYVGGRDCSKLARAMAVQVECVDEVLQGVAPTPPVVPVLCFVDVEWPLLSRTDEFEGVRLEGLRSIRKLLTGRGPLTTDEVNWAADTLRRRLGKA